MLNFIRRVVLAILSAVLLTLSFPSFNLSFCAWIALVPWFFLLRGAKPAAAFGWSYLLGLLFFLGSMSWLLELIKFGGPAAVLGWAALGAYLAVYFGVFGFCARSVLDREQGTGGRKRVKQYGLVEFVVSGFLSDVSYLFLIPSFWVSIEYIRSHLFSGFGWNLLSYSQAGVLPFIQIADITGAWGVSFLLVLFNVALFQLVSKREKKYIDTFTLSFVFILFAFAYGRFRLSEKIAPEKIRVSVVQGNIAQEEKWDEEFKEAIFEKYAKLTREAARENPALIIWPETALPGILGADEALTKKVIDLASSVKTPMLISAPMVTFAKGEPRFTNSAVLFGADGEAIGRYDKLHLVPFGEFVPFEEAFPVLREILPPIGDFVPGKTSTVFKINDLEGHGAWGTGQDEKNLTSLSPRPFPPFSVLICFEDVFPQIARQFVRKGAKFLATITNDAWFGKTSAPYQHAQASTFRAIELRVPMVRAANTGWSGFIDSNGRWVASVHDASGKEIFTEGVASYDINLGSRNSIYRALGDYFAMLCLLISAFSLASFIRRKP
jgi:apolipoprotein N-acyltransferase